jgi:hypothetical protein
MFFAIWGGKPPDPADLARFMSLLQSRQQLTITGSGAKYVLPGVDAETLAKYKDNC